MIPQKRSDAISRKKSEELFRINQHNEEMLQELYKHEEEQDKKMDLLLEQIKQLKD